MPKLLIVAFAFGQPASLRSNQHIATMAAKEARETDSVVFTQSDILPPENSRMKFTYIEQLFGMPAKSTLRIAQRAVILAKNTGVQEICIACAQPHYRRCIRDMATAIGDAGINITLSVCADVWDRQSIWFIDKSTQKWARDPTSWRKRERVMDLLPPILYRWIAG